MDNFSVSYLPLGDGGLKAFCHIPSLLQCHLLPSLVGYVICVTICPLILLYHYASSPLLVPSVLF